MILQPNQEILKQNHDKFLATGNEASIYSASFNSKKISQTTYATIGSIVSKPELFKHFKYFIVDEAHFCNAKGGMYERFFGQMGGRILGVTATPYRLSSNSFGSTLKFLTRTKPRIFSEVIYHIQTKELFDSGYLTPITYYDILEFDRAKVKSNSTGADFDDRSLAAYMEEIELLPRLVQTVRRLIQIRKNGVIFTRFVREAEHLERMFPGKIKLISAETPPKERDFLIKSWQSGEIWGLANVGILTTGVDYPELETVVLASPDKSLARYYQKSGRGIRIHPSKKDTWLVDMCGNYKFFGGIEDLHLGKDKKGLWQISTNGRPLTNVIL